MKKIGFIISILSLVFCSNSHGQTDSTLQDLLKLIDNKAEYMAVRESRISNIMNLKNVRYISLEEQYSINKKLYTEYRSYISDSAIYYNEKNVEVAKRINNASLLIDANLDLAMQYLIGGMYLDTKRILQETPRGEIPDSLLYKYYDVYKLFNTYYSVYNSYDRDVYLNNAACYRDSLLQILDRSTIIYGLNYADQLSYNNNMVEAKNILLSMLDNLKTESHERAMVAYALGEIYRNANDAEQQKKYFTISAISDIKNAIKENAASRALAMVMVETGQIDYAYILMKSSLEDAIFANARLRTFEVSNIFTIIESAYSEKTKAHTIELQATILFISLLVIALVALTLSIYIQMRKLARTRHELSETNSKLSKLNTDLQKANIRMKDINQDLADANQIKETYIGQFMDLCSTYIEKLENYRKSLNKKAAAKQMDDLYKMLKSSDLEENEIKKLYSNFDRIFLHLYPNFIDQFNSLLVEEERVAVKNGELNTELRIFALIRLGISDSSRIAKFLRYSANTIYNYRTRVKNKSAVPRDEFEEYVMNIGKLNSEKYS